MIKTAAFIMAVILSAILIISCAQPSETVIILTENNENSWVSRLLKQSFPDAENFIITSGVSNAEKLRKAFKAQTVIIHADKNGIETIKNTAEAENKSIFFVNSPAFYIKNRKDIEIKIAEEAVILGHFSALHAGRGRIVIAAASANTDINAALIPAFTLGMNTVSADPAPLLFYIDGKSPEAARDELSRNRPAVIFNLTDLDFSALNIASAESFIFNRNSPGFLVRGIRNPASPLIKAVKNPSAQKQIIDINSGLFSFEYSGLAEGKLVEENRKFITLVKQGFFNFFKVLN
jgi:hypothetical protein